MHICALTEALVQYEVDSWVQKHPALDLGTLLLYHHSLHAQSIFLSFVPITYKYSNFEIQASNQDTQLTSKETCGPDLSLQKSYPGFVTIVIFI